MTTRKNNESYLLTQPLMNTVTTTDTRSLSSTSTGSNRESKRTRTIVQPKGTVLYTVAENDTLEKVALRFNATPCELLQLNKLNTRMIFPGQELFVPDENAVNDSNQQQATISLSPPVKPKENDVLVPRTDRRSLTVSSPPFSLSQNQSKQEIGPVVWSMTRQVAVRPGRAQRLKQNSSAESEPSPKTIEEENSSAQAGNDNKQTQKLQRSLSTQESTQLDEECAERFIKAHVRLMTEDRQSVSGTLLVTPNAVMFDPDVLDPLIKANGIDKYGLIIRMDFVAGVSLYEDLTIFEHEATIRDEEKRKHCHSTSVKHLQHNQTNIRLNTDEEQIHDLMLSLLDQIEKKLNPSSTTDTCMLFDASSTLQRHLSRNSLESNNHFDEKTFLPISPDENDLEDSLQFSSDALQPLNEYRHSIGILQEDNEDENQKYHRVASEISYIFDWSRFKRAVKVKKACQLENCVPADQFNKRFSEIDKLLYKQQQSYLQADQIEVPYYLCIRTSMHSYDIPSLYPRQYKRPSEINVDNLYGKKQLEYEYWFAVPKEKMDPLHTFFLRWTPERELQPSIEDDLFNSNEKSPGKGFVLLTTDDPKLTDNHDKRQSFKTEPHYLKRHSTLLKDWEIISVDEIYRRIGTPSPNNAEFYDSSIPTPKFLQRSTLINDEQAKLILLELPLRYQGLDWFMEFSSETHGFSLNQLYRRSVELDRDLPSLLIVKDLEQNIFGGFVPHQLLISEGFYGTGETFLFTFCPEFRVFNWSGYNEYFVKGDLHSIGFGGGDGKYGLWIDADLNRGRTCPSKTFNSEPLTLTEDFIIASIEVWTFID